MEVKGKVLICGDSFAAKELSSVSSWTHLLSDDYSITNIATPGIGEYKILQQLKSKVLSKYDFVIVSHTSPNRIHTMENPLYPNKSHPYHLSDVLFNDANDKKHDNTNAACMYEYFLKVFDVEYYKYVHTCCCHDIDTLTSGVNVFHMTHFEWDDFHQFQGHFHNFYTMWLKNKGQTNHYNDNGNAMIYNTVRMWMNGNI